MALNSGVVHARHVSAPAELGETTGLVVSGI
jgi:hypothetical protein